MVMAIIFTKCGRYDEAIDELDNLLSLKTVFTVNSLRLNEYLRPLWDLPRYQEMIARHVAEDRAL